MNNIIQGLWIGQALSTLEKLSILSYVKHGHEYHLYVYDDVAGVPPQAIIKDANEILPSSMIFRYREHNSYAGFADHFRYKLLLDKGGWWSDLDVVCLKRLDFDAEYVFPSQEEQSGNEVITNCVIKAPKGAAILSNAWTVCSSKDTQELKWGETGPQLVQELARQFSMERYVASSATFCPVPYFRFYEVLLPGRWAEFSAQTYAVHLWNEMWRRLGINRDEVYAPKCLYERLKNIILA